ncbi:retrovirus-related pol polyprotein from transposon TNT 1-94 [Tanacetum coccineum]
MRSFGCPITILNTLDHLGKFNGKADERFFVGYSINSKAFRVFNSRNRIVEETLHITFLENKPNVAGSEPEWLFDIDTLTKSIVISPPVVAWEIKTNINAPGTKEKYRILKSSDDKVIDDVEKKTTEDPAKEDGKDDQDLREFERLIVQGKEAEININNTNSVSAVSSPVNTARTKDVDVNSTNSIYTASLLVNFYGLSYFNANPLDDLKMPNLEDTAYLTLVDLPYGKRSIGTKWVYRNKKDERGIVVRNKARLVTQGYTQEEGIDYDEVFTPVARIEAIRLFLANASFMNFVVYQMDVKSEFLYGKIEEEVYVCQPLGFEDLEFPDRVYKVEKALYGLHQAPKAWSKVMKKEDGIFIRQDKYVDEILKKFGFSTVRIASTPMETSKPLLKDAKAEDVDVHLYRSMIGAFMYLTSSRPDIMFVPDSDYAGASLDRKSTTGANFFAGPSSKSTAWNEFGTNIASAVICLAKKQKVNFSKLVFDAVFNDEYDTPSHTKKVFTNMRRQGKDFSGTVTPLFATMLIQSQVVESEGSEQPTESQHTPTIASPSHSSGPTTLVEDETVYKERGDSVERAATTATSLDAEQGSEDAETHGRYGHNISIVKVTSASVPSDVDVSAASPIRPIQRDLIILPRCKVGLWVERVYGLTRMNGEVEGVALAEGILFVGGEGKRKGVWGLWKARGDDRKRSGCFWAPAGQMDFARKIGREPAPGSQRESWS